MSFLDKMIAKAKTDVKTIVLPESEDVRTIKAAADATAKGIANIILVGDEDAVKALADKEGVDVSGCTVVNPVKPSNTITDPRRLTALGIAAASRSIVSSEVT